MTQEEILQYNKRCAEFLGWKYSQNYESYDELYFEWDENDDGVWYKEENFVLNPKSCNIYFVKVNGVCLKEYEYILKFDSDWNWIMEVLKQITKYGYNWELIDFNGTITEEKFMKCSIFNFELSKPYNKFTAESSDEKEAVVQAINQFLIWYEQNKN